MPGRTIDVPTADGPCDSYIAQPDGGGPFPAVLFFMDGIGIRPVLHRMAERIAEIGRVVLQPNLYFRHGRAPLFDVAKIIKPENRPSLMKIVQSLTPEIVEREAGAFLEYLAAHAEVDADSRVALVGYCMGGSKFSRRPACDRRSVEPASSGRTYHGLAVLRPCGPGSEHATRRHRATRGSFGIRGNSLPVGNLCRRSPRFHDVGSAGLRSTGLRATLGPAAAPVGTQAALTHRGVRERSKIRTRVKQN